MVRNNFRFSGLTDGANETTTAGGDLVVASTVAGAAYTTWTVITPVPLWTFGTFKKIRLQSIDSADVEAASHIWVTSITYDAWEP